MIKHRDLERRLPPGWRIAGLTGGGHLRLAKPGRRTVYVASTPGDRRAMQNALAEVRRAERSGRCLT